MPPTLVCCACVIRAGISPERSVFWEPNTIKPFILAAAATACALITLSAANAGSPDPTSWEVAGQFNAACPAPGTTVWTYGSKTALTAVAQPFNHFPSGYIDGPNSIHGCRKNGATTYPFVSQARKMVPNNIAGPAVNAARGIKLHPGPKCELAFVRFTTPKQGIYAVRGSFYVIDGNGAGTNTNVRIIGLDYDTQPVYSAMLDYSTGKNQASFARSFLIAANKTINFVVGCGNRGDYNYGSTGLHAVIEYWGESRVGPSFPILTRPSPSGSGEMGTGPMETGRMIAEPADGAPIDLTRDPSR